MFAEDITKEWVYNEDVELLELVFQNHTLFQNNIPENSDKTSLETYNRAKKQTLFMAMV